MAQITGTGHRAQGTEHRAQGTEHRAQGTGHRAQGEGHRAQGTGHRAQGEGHRAQGEGHRAQGEGHRAQGTGHRAQGKGRRAQGGVGWVFICISLFVLLFFMGCVKKTDWTFPDEAPVLMVVDGLLTDREEVQEIRLTRPVAGLNEIPEPVAGAVVVLSTDDSTWIMQEDSSESGSYLTPGVFRAQAGKTYTLQIFHEGSVFSAQAAMEAGRFFDELVYVKNEGDDLYHIEWVADAFSPTEPAMWEVLIDWSHLPAYATADSARCHARLLFYTLPTLDVSEIFAPVVETTTFPVGSLITEVRYSLTTQHAAYVRELLLETTWQGSLFPTANANVSTNLSAGGAGYFGVCGVTSLSLIVEE